MEILLLNGGAACLTGLIGNQTTALCIDTHLSGNASLRTLRKILL